jgi:predicted nuclease of predicted toxin-antitoxin system
MKFLADENIPLAAVNRLRFEGFDIKAVVEETPGAADRAVLQLAVQEQHILLTFDRDYGELVFRAHLPVPSGIVYFRYDPYPAEEPAEHLMKLLQIPELELTGKFTVAERQSTRQRSMQQGKE